MALPIWKAVVLGVVQGLTEWLPVSSDGHLVLAQILLDVHVPVFFDAVLHVATLVVILVFFRRTVAAVLRALARIPADRRAGAGWRAIAWDDPDRRLALLVVIGSMPTAIAGLLLLGAIDDLYQSKLAAGLGFLVTGTVVWFARERPAAPRRAAGWREALLMGAAQGLAILPGVSRSGLTIGSALARGVDREEAARLSFLLAAPAIVGATILQADAASLASAAGDWPAYAIGALVAGFVGYASLALLVLILRHGGFHRFAWYCWALGLAVVAWALTA